MAKDNARNMEQSLINCVTVGLQQTISGVLPSNWFGPSQPIPQQAPPDTPIRILDYLFGLNLIYQPGVTDTVEIPFHYLREVADRCDIVRLCIETRKDQVAKIPWAFRLRPLDKESATAHQVRSASDPRVNELNKQFRYPDGERDWQTWVRSVLEEVFVTDALSLAPRWASEEKTKLVALDQIDGSMVSRKIDVQGRTPAAPSVAYQLYIKGVPAIDLTTRDLIYKPRNYRPHRIYGFSPVQQILMTINTIVRRQMTQLSFYTEGNIPDSIVSLGPEWSADSMKQLQDQFDVLAGNIAKRSRLRFIPETKNIVFPKEKMLMDQMDEWLARICCYAFSLSPQPFVKMMNRGTAQNATEQALQEGLMPILDWIAGLLTFIVEKYMGYDDIEFAFLDDEISDPLEQAQVDKIYASMGKTSIDELRRRDGQEPLGIGNMIITPNGPIPLAPFCGDGALSQGLPQHTNPNPTDPMQALSDPNAPSSAQPGAPRSTKPITSKNFKSKFRRRWSY